MEPLTLAERNLQYQIRTFARFRQQFFPTILTTSPTAGGQTGLGVPRRPGAAASSPAV